VLAEFAFALRGCEISCGALLVVAGVSKAYRGVRGIEADTAIRRTLRIPRRGWRYAELAAGLVECGIGGCVLVWPGGAGAAMAAAGAVFCVLLGYARAKRIPGGCGCLGWRTPMSETITWRPIVRSGMLLAVGAASAGVALAGHGAGAAGAFAGHGAGAAGAFRDAWCYAGILAVGTTLALPGMFISAPARTPVCRRPLWRPVRAAVRALAGHEIFAAVAAAEGPFAPEARYRRTGCTEEFWFTSETGDAVVFRVRYQARGGSPAIHMAMNAGPDSRPARQVRWLTRGHPGSYRMPKADIPAFRARVRQERCSRPIGALANKSVSPDLQAFRMIYDTDCLPLVPPGRPGRLAAPAARPPRPPGRPE
jgi:hypothetical protein